MQNKFTEIWVQPEYTFEELADIVEFYLTDSDITAHPIFEHNVSAFAREMVTVHLKIKDMLRGNELGRKSVGASDGSDINISMRNLKDWAMFVRRLSGVMGNTRSLIEGALYIYRDSLKGKEDKELIKNQVLPVINQESLEDELIDIDALDVLEEKGKSWMDVVHKDDGDRRISDRQIAQAEIVDEFDEIVVGMAGVRGIDKIRDNLSVDTNFEKGIMGIAMLPLRRAMQLFDLIMGLDDDKIRLALIRALAF